MKTIQISLRAIALVCFISTATLLSAASPNALANQMVRKEVTKMIQNPELNKNGIKAGDVLVSFTINKENEVVLLDIASNHTYLKNFVKEKLHNQKVTTDNVGVGQEYNIKISFESER